ncbi:MAG: glucuronate isomerase, partial [Sphingobacteriia bacterium 35-40-5]
MSSYFLTDDFLLQGKQAKNLYHYYVKNLPIIDYHCHLPPDEIAGNKQFANLTEIWLKGDHYKWRAQRTLGVNETFITGSAADELKFHHWARVVPQTVRNPLFHWTHMELKNVFGVEEYLNETSGPKIYQHCNELLQTPEFTTRSLLEKFKVEYVGTTDEPWDKLAYHKQLVEEQFSIKVSPSFRPDKILFIEKQTDFFHYLGLLEDASGVVIKDIPTLLDALKNRVDYFHDHGCRVSDHGFEQMPGFTQLSLTMEMEFEGFLKQRSIPYSAPEHFMGFVLLELCK